MKRKVLLIAGPGDMAFGKSEVDNFKHSLQNNKDVELYSLGDGEKPISLSGIEKKLEEMSLHSGENTVIIYSHGMQVLLESY